MDTRHVILAMTMLVASACGSALPPDPVPVRPGFGAILREPKFMPRGDYMGADVPADREPLQAAVNAAICDVAAMREPLDPASVRRRLKAMLDETDAYATEDWDEVGRYAVRIWRAAGFKRESGLFAVSDDRALSSP